MKGKYLSKKPTEEVSVRDYETVLKEIRSIAKQQEEYEKEKEMKKRHNTHINAIEDLFWKYSEEELELKDGVLLLHKPIDVELFVKIKSDCRQFGIKNVKVEV